MRERVETVLVVIAWASLFIYLIIDCARHIT